MQEPMAMQTERQKSYERIKINVKDKKVCKRNEE